MKNILSILFVILLLGVAGYSFYKSQYTTGLSGFTQLTKEDPLFYSGFFDEKAFTEGLARAEESVEALKTISIKSIKKNKEREELYVPLLEKMQVMPFSFLKLLPSINTAHQEFLAEPTKERAEALLSLYGQAAKAYSDSINEDVAAFDTITAALSQDKLFVYFFVDSASSIDVVYDDFLTIQKNAEALVKEVEERKACLDEKLNCKSLIRPAKSSDLLLALDKKFDGNEERKKFVESTFPYPTLLERVGGPYQLSSSCWPSAGGAPWINLLVYKDAPNVFPFMAKLATQNYYSSVPKQPTDVINKELRKEGLDYHSQLEASTYECTDLTFYPKLLTLDSISQQIAHGSTTRAMLEKDPAYKSLIANQFGAIGPVFSTISTNINLLTLSQQVTSSVISPQFLLINRSAYGLFFFPYAQSIWRIDEGLTYLLPEDPQLRKNISSLTTTIDRLEELGYTDEKIRTLHVRQQALVESLLKH